MSLRRRLSCLLVLALAAVFALATPALAATSSANKAATWLTSQVSGGALDNGFDKVGGSADGLIGIAAATDPALQPTITKLLTFVKSGAAGYVSAGGASAAAKLAIVADAYGLDPTSFGGVDLVDAMTSGIESDGAVGPYPSAFSSGLTMVGLQRAAASRPSVLTTWLLTQQNTDGGFGYATGVSSDADNTALAILGLTTDSSDTAKTALNKALEWAAKNQNADGSWDGYEPINSTCVIAEAQLAAGISNAKALAYVTSKQLSNGAIAASAGADVMATSQCLPLLGGRSYADVTWQPISATTPPTTTTTTTTSKPTATTTSTSPSSTTPTATTPGRGVPARTGVEDDATLPIAVMVLTLGAAIARLGLRR